MGVMPCSRKKCNNILCDVYIETIGYICSDCILEFKTYLQENNLDPKTEREIVKELSKFITISKDTYFEDKEISVDSFFIKRYR